MGPDELKGLRAVSVMVSFSSGGSKVGAQPPRTGSSFQLHQREAPKRKAPVGQVLGEHLLRRPDGMRACVFPIHLPRSLFKTGDASCNQSLTVGFPQPSQAPAARDTNGAPTGLLRKDTAPPPPPFKEESWLAANCFIVVKGAVQTIQAFGGGGNNSDRGPLLLPCSQQGLNTSCNTEEGQALLWHIGIRRVTQRFLLAE